MRGFLFHFSKRKENGAIKRIERSERSDTMLTLYIKLKQKIKNYIRFKRLEKLSWEAFENAFK